MADISKIVVPSGDEYNIKDSTSRSGLADKMDKVNPTGSGSFSLNRKANTTIGADSFAEGYNGTASGFGSHAEGQGTTASGRNAHAEGTSTTASDDSAHAEGSNTIANGGLSHAEGYSTTASGYGSHTEGYNTTASGSYSHAEGYYTTASGNYSHADGFYSTANHKSQHVFGEYNDLDDSTAAATARGNYVEIVGNGTADNSRSNARTLDWSGNEVLSGTIEATGFGTTLDKEVDRGGVQLTQAQYDALVDAGTVDANTTYFITDVNNTAASYAAGVTYDNTDSGLTATNVQDAIDEVKAATDSLFLVRTYTASDITINAKSRKTLTQDDLNISSIDGYFKFAIRAINPNSSAGIAIQAFNTGGVQLVVSLYNTTDSAITVSPEVTIVYVKREFVEI